MFDDQSGNIKLCLLMRRKSCIHRKVFCRHEVQIGSIDEARMVNDSVHTHFSGLEGSS